MDESELLRRYGAGERNFSGIRLAFSRLAGSQLPGVNLSRVSLFSARLTGADLGAANLSGANLSGANLSGAFLNITTNTDGMTLCRTIWTDGTLRNDSCPH